MKYQRITEEKQKEQFNKQAKHPLQSWEWGEFRSDSGIKVERYGIYEGKKIIEPIQVTVHKIPKSPWSVGYMPKGYMPTDTQVSVLKEIAKRHRCILVKVEPKVENKEVGEKERKFLREQGFVKGRPLFTKYNFVLNITKNEDELMGGMKSKTRYNVRLAQRRGVKVSIDNSDQAFEEYLRLTMETTKRQGFYAHTQEYHRKMWKRLKESGMAHLMKATYKGKTLTAWILFLFNGVLYYPYGASSSEHREVMASNLVMWEAIRFGKKQGAVEFDMWGALGPEADKSDPWYGFHRFKEGYGGELVEYMGTYDLVTNPLLYWPFRAAESLRWAALRAVARFR